MMADKSLEKVEVDGVQCHMRVFGSEFIQARKRLGHSDICPLCRRQFGPEDEIYLILNNFKLFPNAMCHTGCVDGPGKEEAIRLLDAAYSDAKRAMAEAKERMRPWRRR